MPDFSDLRALFVNCTLKPGTEPSNTQALMDNDRDHARPRDDWPALQERVFAADILVLGTPIWRGEKSSIATRVIERLYGYSGQLNDAGQWIYYGRVGGGPENEFTQRNTTFMAWNLMHMARMLKDAGGIPAYGNQRAEWDAGARFDHPNPEYR